MLTLDGTAAVSSVHAVPLRFRLRPEVRDRLAYGLLWGLLVWLLETSAFIFTRERLSSAGSLLVVLALFWITRGMALAVVAGWLAERLRPARAWALFPVIAVLWSLAWDGSASLSGLVRDIAGVDLPPAGQFLFTLWPMLAYGAPLFAFCVVDVRSRRTRALLAQAEAARMASATAIDAARLEHHARRVDPAMLLHSLQDVRSAIESGDVRAGTRVDALVEFLRAAMPAARGTEGVFEPDARDNTDQGGSHES